MPFWSTDFGADTELKDPKRKFRFKVEFHGIQSSQGAGGALLWYAKSVAKPSFQIAAAEHKYLNHTFYYPGSVTWQDVSLTLVDPVNPDMTATLADIIELSGYSIPTTANSLNTMSKASAAGALGSVMITQIDSKGEPLETWTLWNAFIINLKFGDLAYGEDDLTELTVDLKYDWASVVTSNGGGSAAVKGGGDGPFFNV